jgi:hypothetical protein
MGNIHY